MRTLIKATRGRGGGALMQPAARTRIRRAGYEVERGAYIGTTDDRADRWYLYRATRTCIDRRGPGFATLREAAEAAEEVE